MHAAKRFQEALRRFDEENSRDPNRTIVEGVSHPREALYARWLSDWVAKLCPAPSEALLLAARCQHLRRWEIPRDSYEMDRAGYLRWRSELKKFHARKSAEILRELGFPEETIVRVQELNLKQNLGQDPECQTLEDALCLVTLQHQLGELMARTAPDKLVGILRKTWKKMSPEGRRHALALSFPEARKALLEQALSPEPEPAENRGA